MVTAVDDAVTRRAAKSKRTVVSTCSEQKKSAKFLRQEKIKPRGFCLFLPVKLVIKEFTGSFVQ